jgi:hypothetical protein
LLDPRKPGQFKYEEYEFDFEPFYVGKGSGDRWVAHIRETKGEWAESSLQKNPHKLNKIKKS